MKAPDLMDRVLGALRLEPMSPRELSLVLTTTERKVREALQKLHSRGLVQLLSSRKAWIRAPNHRRAA
ncbi:hypothetical protein [Dyella lutea]|uniref:Uncharacterized protein n=1 Tax=Dyella lutea TaxID=2950441 RepID=A0ABT1FF84_9GAMM|nr:hypothetical protein [Dyella lutea]MCP1376017.1 hypothetical protein [Dyella lutea]